ncbi:MAG: hypothetical protein KKA16_07685 [Alphaproteobacteria bacterium]|nr:hypothetical protein [Alphaproteobacteria bacterium]MBU2379794.1 hypothetical protein [Alphaproteobacteria bacterium]
MTRAFAGAIVLGLMVVAPTASAQVHLGKNFENGLHWSVAAPQGASWSLECRFAPVTYEASQYDLRHWTNRIRTGGTGADRGRLPQQDGRCTVTKTGGAGPVGIAMVRGSEVVADGVAETGKTARAGLL